MKPFNLQEALAGKAVKLRDGSKAYVRHHETELPVDEDMRLIGFLPDGGRLSWYENGNYCRPGRVTDEDIIGMYPETRVINGFEVPAPESTPLTKGEKYYIPNIKCTSMCDKSAWHSDNYDLRMLKRGLVFLSFWEAVATAKAMMGIDPNNEDET